MRGLRAQPTLAILCQKLLHSPDVLDFERTRMLTHSNCRGDIDATFALLAGLFTSLSETDISIVERPCRSAVGKPRGGLFLTGRTSHPNVDCRGGPDWAKVWHRFESDLC